MKENAAEFDTQLDDVFARIASRYDLLCDLFSLASVGFSDISSERLTFGIVAILTARKPELKAARHGQ